MSPSPPPPAPPQGLYIFGDVGTGKSLVMDLFLTAMRRAEPSINTQRLHFHAFTTQVHELIHRSGVTDQTSTELLPSVAHELLGLPQCEAQTGPALLCFDEFQCNDIFTATILQALVGYVLDRGVTLVATSNRAPMELNKHLLRGAQKETFDEFLTNLASHSPTHQMSSSTDYRKAAMESTEAPPPRFYHPLNAETRESLHKAYNEARGTSPPSATTIPVAFGRSWRIEQCNGSVSRGNDNAVAFLSFNELCDSRCTRFQRPCTGVPSSLHIGCPSALSRTSRRGKAIHLVGRRTVQLWHCSVVFSRGRNIQPLSRGLSN